MITTDFFTSTNYQTPLTEIKDPVLAKAKVELFIKREDLIHPIVSGNKFRKLKYNLLEAQEQNHTTVLTFGGAYSNHIAATAMAGKLCGFKTIGIIRGEELGKNLSETLATNTTLQLAHTCGMQLEFVSRTNYRLKDSSDYISALRQRYGNFYLIPEGGTNTLAIRGCREILTREAASFTHICCSVGTGGTLAGLVEESLPSQKIIGFPALKGNFLREEIAKYTNFSNWYLIKDYHFGGYAKVTAPLINFINSFYTSHKILLDPIYTGKLLFGIFHLVGSGYFSKNSRIFAVHTGGLQGIKSMNDRLVKMKLPLIATTNEV